ncbi:uncharacterized protein LOC141902556 isoform X1 [Tubulanus polymorphus]|uniref:uncharacterized protein LOC141902556 isoform X1 n=1 Tax=Tubulanus polymorphus TaxID=672921 RepID=UPI003DA5E054
MVKFTLDHATYQKVMEGDQETINQLAENYSEAFRVPSAGIEINPKSEQRDTAIQEREASTSVPPGHSVARKTAEEIPRAAVLLLIDHHKALQNKFNDSKTKKKTLWQDIAKKMKTQGFDYTWLQLKTKWGNILQVYRKTRDHNCKTGREPKTCLYYEELDSYLGTRPNSRPALVKKF